MSVDFEQFREIVLSVIGKPLQNSGFSLNDDKWPLIEGDYNREICFYKELTINIHVAIGIQARTYDMLTVTEYTINLYRNTFYLFFPLKTTIKDYRLLERLAPGRFLAKTDKNLLKVWPHANSLHDRDYWWYFINQDQLINECKDTVSKLYQYAIPYLENLDSKPKHRQFGRPNYP
ncbi:MAG TPA: hypothetical protein VLL52_21580 [Anaerolineae bacterium]|nr:hypothetical protein [Anaerolineae bacterium]